MCTVLPLEQLFKLFLLTFFFLEILLTIYSSNDLAQDILVLFLLFDHSFEWLFLCHTQKNQQAHQQITFQLFGRQIVLLLKLQKRKRLLVFLLLFALIYFFVVVFLFACLFLFCLIYVNGHPQKSDFFSSLFIFRDEIPKSWVEAECVGKKHWQAPYYSKGTSSVGFLW